MIYFFLFEAKQETKLKKDLKVDKAGPAAKSSYKKSKTKSSKASKSPVTTSNHLLQALSKVISVLYVSSYKLFNEIKTSK